MTLFIINIILTGTSTILTEYTARSVKYEAKYLSCFQIFTFLTQSRAVIKTGF